MRNGAVLEAVIESWCEARFNCALLESLNDPTNPLDVVGVVEAAMEVVVLVVEELLEDDPELELDAVLEVEEVLAVDELV
jgi:hypothetical protein